MNGDPRADIRHHRLLMPALLWIARAALVLIILFAGAQLRKVLARRRTGSQTRPPEELVRTVRGVTVREAPVQLHVTGYGTAEPVRAIEISAEVGGRILETLSELKPGRLVTPADRLFRIDPEDYELLAAQRRADLLQLDAQIAARTTRNEQDLKRRQLLERTAKLNESDFARAQDLFQNKGIGSKSDVERAERVLRQSEAALVLLDGQLAAFGPEIASLNAQKARATAMLREAELALRRCAVHPPWPGRITAVHAEQGQFANRGQSLLSLADDRVLEITATVSGKEALGALGLGEGADEAYPHWFGGVPDSVVELAWVEQPDSFRWQGRIVRIAAFDTATRTVRVVVRPEPAEDGHPALVAGMFCEVRIPGRRMAKALRVPRSAIQLGGVLFVVDGDNRLVERRPVIAHDLGDTLVLSAGVASGERIVSTRLGNVLSGTRVRFEDGETP